jgi:DNA polymerase III subunit gamma/tau
MRDAESTLDQLISFCGTRIEEPDVLSMFGLAAQQQVRSLFRAVLAADPRAALQELDELCRHGKDLARLLADLLAHGRNLLLFALGAGKTLESELSEAELASLREESGGLAPGELSRVLEVLAGCERQLRDAPSKRVQLEIGLLKSIEARRSIGVDELLSQLARLRAAGVGSAAEATSRAPVIVDASTATPRSDVSPVSSTALRPSESSPPALPSPAPPTPVREPVEGAPGLQKLWMTLVGGLATSHRFLQSYLSHAHPISLEREVFTIGFPVEAEAQLELASTERNRLVLQTRLAELGVPVRQIRLTVAPPPPGSGSAPEPETLSGRETPAPPVAPVAAAGPTRSKPAPFDKEAFKNDPLIQKALEIFKGQIVEIRT